MTEPLPLIAVLDANVLVPAPIRDILLWLAFIDFYQPRWSDTILEELRRTLVVGGFTNAERADYLIDTMATRFPRAKVTNFDHVIASMTNHPGDRHVLAAAVTTGASVIVTDNIRHFRKSDLAPHAIEAQTTDRFLTDRFNEQPEMVLRLLYRQASVLRSPPMTVREVLGRLRIHAPTFVERVSATLDTHERP